MSAWTELKDSIRKIILMESRLDGLTDAIDRLADQSLDHEKRLIRIETMIEVAQGHDSGPKQLR
jgi:hypothetical protein